MKMAGLLFCNNGFIPRLHTKIGQAKHRHPFEDSDSVWLGLLAFLLIIRYFQLGSRSRPPVPQTAS